MSAGRCLLSLLCAQVVSALLLSNSDCKTVPSEAWNLTLVYAGYPAYIEIPALPAAGADYSYAKDNALIALPTVCAIEFADDLQKTNDLLEKLDCLPSGMKYVRINDITGGWTKLMEMGSCADGIVMGFHGSGGVGWGQVQFATIFSGLGYIHVMLDSQAMPDSLGLKGRRPLKSADQITTSAYCGSYSGYENSCSGFAYGSDKPYCYSTKYENIVNDQDAYRQFVEGIYQIRKREVDYFIDSAPANFFEAFTKVYAVGNSEGGMVLSRYNHANFNRYLNGVIIDGYACEWNYYQSCEANANICEDACNKTIKMLNIIGEDDEYFGIISTSMAQRVAGDEFGYGSATITGNCHARFVAQGFNDHTTIVAKGTAHTPKYWVDNLVRDAVESFVTDGNGAWIEKNECADEAGVYKCELPDVATCMPGWTLNPDEAKRCEDDGVPALSGLMALMFAVVVSLLHHA